MGDPVDILARTVWGEDRGGGMEGMAAIANVVLNRVNHPGWWGDTIVSVCLKPWQFSCWNHGDPNREKLLDVTKSNPEFADALVIAQAAVAGTLRDRTNGATSYYNPAIVPEPAWAKGLTPCAVIDGQRFYRLAG